MASTATYLARFREGARYYGSGVWKLLNEKDIFLWAQAIAFKVLVTLVPAVLLATGVLGQVLRGDEAFAGVARFIRNFLPPYQSDQLLAFLHDLQAASGTITVIGVAGLLFSVMTLFSTLRAVVANTFQEEWHRPRTVLVGYLFDLRMTVQVGLLFLLSMGLSVAMQTVNQVGTEFLAFIGLEARWIEESWGRLFALFGLLLPFLLSVAMFFQLFYFIPKPHPPRRSALIGALVTAVLWEAAKYGFTFYATRAGRFEYQVQTGDEGLRALGSTFGLIIAFVFWVYYSGLVLTIGGLFGLLNEKRVRARRKREHVEQLQKRLAAGEAGPDDGHPRPVEMALPDGPTP